MQPRRNSTSVSRNDSHSSQNQAPADFDIEKLLGAKKVEEKAVPAGDVKNVPKATISPSSLIWHLLKKNGQLFDFSKETIEKLKDIIVSWRGEIEKVQSMIGEVRDKLDGMKVPDKKASQGVDIVEVYGTFDERSKVTIQSINQLLEALHISNNEEEIAGKIYKVLEGLPSLLNSFDNLNLEAIFGEKIPASLDDIKQLGSKFIYDMLLGVIPVDIAKHVLFIPGRKNVDSEKKISVDDKSVPAENKGVKNVNLPKLSNPFAPENFAKLPRVNQLLLLVFLQSSHSVISKMYLRLRKLGSNTGLNIVDEPFNLTGYELARLMGSNKPEAGKIYLKKHKEHLEYQVIDSQGIVKEGSIQKSELNNSLHAKFDAITKLDDFKPLLTPILRITSQRGHTSKGYAFSDLCKKLSDCYKQCMEIAGYTKSLQHEDLYPYNKSVQEEKKQLIIQGERKEQDMKSVHEVRRKSFGILEDKINRCGVLNKKRDILLRLQSKLQQKHIMDALREISAGERKLLNSGETKGIIYQIIELQKEEEKKRNDNHKKWGDEKCEEDLKQAAVVEVSKPHKSLPDIISHVMAEMPKLKEAMANIKYAIVGNESVEVKDDKKDQKNESQEQPKDEPFNFDRTIAVLDGLQNGMKKSIDPVIYEQFFVKGKKGVVVGDLKDSKYGDGGGNLWIQRLGMICINFQDITNTLRIYKKPEQQSEDPAQDLMDLASKLTDSVQQLSKITREYADFKEHPLKEVFASMQGVKDVVLPHANDMKAKFDPLLQSVKGQSDLFAKVHAVYKNLCDTSFQDPKAVEAVGVLKNCIQGLQARATELTQGHDALDPISKKDALLFTWINFPYIMWALGSVSTSINTMQAVSKDFVFYMAKTFHELIKDIFLAIDELETHLYLQDGVLAKFEIQGQSLYGLAAKFYAMAEQQGYAFEESFPFYESTHKQRQKMSHSDLTTQQYLQRKVGDVKKLLDADRVSRNYHKTFDEFFLKKEAATLVKARHDKLKEEQEANCLPSPYRDSKIKLLGCLMEVMTQEEGVDINSSLTKVMADKDPEEINAMYTGRTGDVIKTLQNKQIKKQDIVDKIHLRIALLKVNSGNADAQNRIYALTQFLKCYQTIGCTFTMAFSDMRVRCDAYDVLCNAERDFMREVRDLDNGLPAAAREKYKLDRHTVFTPLKDGKAEHQTDEDVLKMIHARVSELKASYFDVLGTKAKKIIVLNKLSAKLTDGMSLNAALEVVRKEHTASYHLLFDGKTGEMMTRIEHRNMSKEQMIYQINLEIQRLYGRRTEKLFFFAESRKARLEDRIQALIHLRDNFAENGVAGFNSLSLKDKEMLMSHEKRIMESFWMWREQHSKEVFGVK